MEGHISCLQLDLCLVGSLICYFLLEVVISKLVPFLLTKKLELIFQETKKQKKKGESDKKKIGWLAGTWWARSDKGNGSFTRQCISRMTELPMKPFDSS